MSRIFCFSSQKPLFIPYICLPRSPSPAQRRWSSSTAKGKMSFSDPETRPDWLQTLLRSKGTGPKIYKWTVNDIERQGNGALTTATSDNSTSPDDDARRRIYILGLGNLGRLFAVGLSKLPNSPPVTLVVHKRSLLEHWQDKPGVTLHRQDFLQHRSASEDDTFTGFDVELWSEEPPPQPCPALEIGFPSASPTGKLPSSNARIFNLIIATKTQDAMRQADWVRRYLGPESTVVFVQNGMNKLWPPYGPLYDKARYPEVHEHSVDVATRHPHWMAAVVTHGVTSVGPFESIHASPAGVVLGTVSGGSPNNGQHPTDSFLVNQLLASPLLNTRYSPRPELLIVQFEKLVVNSIINSLTAVLRCRNGELFITLDEHGSTENQQEIVSRVIDRLLEESSNVLKTLVQYDSSSREILQQPSYDEAATDKGSDYETRLQRLSFPGLRSMLYRVAAIVAENRSSMLQDVEARKPTEVREFNGWFVETAAYLKNLDTDATQNLDVTAHKTLLELVESQKILDREGLSAYFPQVRHIYS